MKKYVKIPCMIVLLHGLIFSACKKEAPLLTIEDKFVGFYDATYRCAGDPDTQEFLEVYLDESSGQFWAKMGGKIFSLGIRNEGNTLIGSSRNRGISKTLELEYIDQRSLKLSVGRTNSRCTGVAIRK